MPRPVRRMLLVRSAVLWVAAHVVAAAGAVVGGPVRQPGVLAPSAALLTVVLVSALIALDVRRRGEHVLLGNLGIGTSAVVTTAALVPAAAELIISVVAAL
ncbi:MAG: hypothetical protein OER21_03595 [Gemmatimonadota bacterium]|nr:hypothetical protein [Gemmatimonadota bacterium]